MANNLRGSDLVKHRYTDEDLARLIEAGDIEEARLIDVFPLGMPKPDEFVGGLESGRAGAA